MRLQRIPDPRSSRAGFSPIEVLCGIVVVTIATLSFAQVLVGGMRMSDTTQQRALALEQARRILEELQDEDFARVYALHDASTANDPDGVGTAPGPSFDVDGLDPLASDADGRVGAIVFPVVNGALREDADLPELGMPLDLDGDGGIDAVDHAGDYRLLPVLVRVEWRGPRAPMVAELRTILSER